MVRRRLLFGSLAALGVVAGMLVSGQAAQATVAFTLYASPTGSGTACSSAAPCSLDQAKTTAHDDAVGASGDIEVFLADGTYQLSSTLTFTSADSVSGHTVTYEAAASAHPILSGGVPVAVNSWSEIDTSKHIWKALVPDDMVTAATRQIYVDGVRAGVDTKNTATVFTSMALDPNGAGYTYTATGPNSWTNTSDVDFVYPGTAAGAVPYTHSMCPATSIGAGKVTMATVCWQLKAWWGIPAAVQNNQALLGTPGQFYLDMHSTADAGEHQLYYVPRPGEDMTTAQVIVPQLQTLVQVTGASGLTFQGIGFEHGTWNLDGTGATVGQENSLWQGTSSPHQEFMLHPNVLCDNCTKVTFTGDTFTHLGGSGLGFDQGGANNTIVGNSVTDVSGNGIQVGDLGAPWTLVTGTIIKDNFVSDVSKEYLNGVGIFTGVVSGTAIDHNEVANVPYDGITLGGPVGTSSGQGDNHITHNYIHDVMSSNIRDGGPIYVTGYQSSSPRSTIQGNYIDGDPLPYGSLYLDTDSDYWDVSNNVVSGYSYSWVFLQYGNGGPAYYNNVTDNYVDARAGTVHTGNYGTGIGNTQSGNQIGLTGGRWPAAAQTVMSQAGLELAYQALNPTSPQANLALAKPASDTTGTPAGKGNDGVGDTVFSSAAVSGTAHWQVDLGSLHKLSHLQILERTDGNAPAELANLQVLVSNSPSLTTGTTTASACTTGSMDLPAMSLWDCPLPAGPWRYVTIEKTDGQPLAFSEARVFGTGATVSTIDDTAPGINYIGAWTPETSSNGGQSNFDDTQHVTSTNGAALSYTFYGTGINVISAQDSTRGNMKVAIDGVVNQTVSCASPTTIYQQTCAGVSGLAAGTHTIMVTKVDGTTMSLDAFQIIAPFNIAQAATATASSEYSTAYHASNAIDGIARIHATGEWASAGVQNPSLTLTLPSVVPVTQVTFYDRPNTVDNANGGTLTFSNGDTVDVAGIPADGTPHTVTFPEENTTSIKFQVVGGTGTNVGLSEITVADTSRPNLALTATATASSTFGTTYSAVAAADGITGISDVGEWASNGETTPWLNLAWSSSQTINQVTFYDRPNTVDNANGGTLTFSNGDTVTVTGIPTNGAPYTVSFPAETTTSLRFQVVGGTGTNVGLSEMAVADTRKDLAPAATATASSTFGSTYTAAAATDGITGINDFGEWASNGELNPWLKLTWNSSQTINHVTFYDRPSTADNANGGTLTFSNGDTVTVTGIPTNGIPYTVSFPAENTTSLKFQIVGGAGYNVGLSELEAYDF